MDHAFTRLIDDALHALWQRDPVTATFAGERAFDAVLPRGDATAEADECRAIDALAQRLAATPVDDGPSARIDARHLDAYCTLACTEFARRARYRNPAWYTGEATFGLISLLLRGSDAATAQSLAARMRAIPGYLDDGVARLRDVPLPAAWSRRARTELDALKRLMSQGFPLHPAGAAIAPADADAVARACDRFAAALPDAPAADAACGANHLALIIKRVHGLDETLETLERRASDAFDELRARLETQARKLDPARTWREQIAQLSAIGPDGGDVVSTYAYWHERALNATQDLLTPASDYALTFAPLPDWARTVAADLYFLFYRSPDVRDPGSGSPYWVTPTHGSAAQMRRAHNTAAVKLVHAVHHGSIGHHTQNARARSAGSRFARIAGTDAAAGIALLSGGTMVEGWACYAEDLLAEVPGFYTAAETLQLAYFEFRNIAGCLADIRFHTGAYDLDGMRAFYCDEAGFAPDRAATETTRNSMFPGSRIMYWCGTRQIRALRSASPLTAKAFHDELLAFGATPIAWIAEELAR